MSDLILTAVTAAPGRDEEERVARHCHVVRTRGNMVPNENSSNGRSLFQMDRDGKEFIHKILTRIKFDNKVLGQNPSSFSLAGFQ